MRHVNFFNEVEDNLLLGVGTLCVNLPATRIGANRRTGNASGWRSRFGPMPEDH